MAEQTLKVKITMADGTVRDNLVGVKVPYNNRTAPAFEIIKRVAVETLKKQQEKGA